MTATAAPRPGRGADRTQARRSRPDHHRGHAAPAQDIAVNGPHAGPMSETAPEDAPTEVAPDGARPSGGVGCDDEAHARAGVGRQHLHRVGRGGVLADALAAAAAARACSASSATSAPGSGPNTLDAVQRRDRAPGGRGVQRQRGRGDHRPDRRLDPDHGARRGGRDRVRDLAVVGVVGDVVVRRRDHPRARPVRRAQPGVAADARAAAVPGRAGGRDRRAADRWRSGRSGSRALLPGRLAGRRDVADRTGCTTRCSGSRWCWR